MSASEQEQRDELLHTLRKIQNNLVPAVIIQAVLIFIVLPIAFPSQELFKTGIFGVLFHFGKVSLFLGLITMTLAAMFDFHFNQRPSHGNHHSLEENEPNDVHSP